MYKAILFQIFFFSVLWTANAQVTSGMDAQENLNQLGGLGNVVRTMKPVKANTQGSPLLMEHPELAFPYSNGKKLDSAYFNFHVGEKKLIVQTRNGDRFIEELIIDSLFFYKSNRTLINANLVNKDLEKIPFEIVHLKAGGKLYIDHQVQFIPASYQGAYSSGVNYDEYIKKMEFYFYEEEAFTKIKINKNWFKKNYQGYPELIDYVNRELLNFGDYDDQLKIIDFVKLK
jgi:hypothetical protein